MSYKSLKILGVQFATGNSKVGHITSVSFAPIASCAPDVPCAKRGQGYCLKAYCQYKATRDCQDTNLEIARKDPERYFRAIRMLLANYKGRFFRYQVNGDMLGRDAVEKQQAFLDEIKAIALEFPTIKFLVFTKLHHLNFKNKPENLSIILSFWPGWGNLRRARAKKLPVCWVRDPKHYDKRIPSNAIECSGSCETCGMCWSLKETGKDVVINKH